MRHITFSVVEVSNTNFNDDARICPTEKIFGDVSRRPEEIFDFSTWLKCYTVKESSKTFLNSANVYVHLSLLNEAVLECYPREEI